MTETSTQDQPATTQEADNKGDALTTGGDALTQMVANEFDKNPPPSEGDVTSTEPQALPGQPEPQVPDTGKITRMEQALGDQKRVLAALGIDADSDDIEKFNKGIITKEQLLKQEPAKPQQPATAYDKLTQYRTKIEDKVKTGQPISGEDFSESLNLMSEIVDENRQLQNQSKVDNLMAQCQGATQAVLDKDELHSKTPENIQEIESQMFLSSTDFLLGEATKGNPQYFTPQAYEFYAQKNLEKFNALRNHWIEVGKEMAKPKPPPANPINPISSETGGAPIPQPQTMINLDNMNQAAHNYARAQGNI